MAITERKTLTEYQSFPPQILEDDLANPVNLDDTRPSARVLAALPVAEAASEPTVVSQRTILMPEEKAVVETEKPMTCRRFALIGCGSSIVAASVLVALAARGCQAQAPVQLDYSTPTLTPRVSEVSESMTPEAFMDENGFSISPTPLPVFVSAEEPSEVPTQVRQRDLLSGFNDVEILGPHRPVVPSSVVPGGINRSDAFTQEEALWVSWVYNGAAPIELLEGNVLKLAAARNYAEANLGVTGRIDTNTMQSVQGGVEEMVINGNVMRRLSENYFVASGDGRIFEIYEVSTPRGYRFNQIAVYDNRPGVAFANNGSLVGGEHLYVIRVLNSQGEVTQLIQVRSACGNFGRAEGEGLLVQPTLGATSAPLATPTGVFEQTPVTPVVQITNTLPPAMETPRPRATENPTITPQNPEPTGVPRQPDEGTPTQPPTPVPTVPPPATPERQVNTPVPAQASPTPIA